MLPSNQISKQFIPPTTSQYIENGEVTIIYSNEHIALMSLHMRRLLGSCLFLGILMLVLLLFTGGASATPDTNNDISQAVEVHNYDTVFDSLSDADDWDDYYMIQMDAGEVLDVYLVMDVGTDFDIYIIDSSLNVLASSTSDNAALGIYTEQVSYIVPASGWYYIDVYAYLGSGDYSLLIRSTAEWTFLVYMDSDNNLEEAGIDDFLEMSSIGSTPEMNIVVQMDRVPGYDTSYDDWIGANRYRVGTGMVPNMASAMGTLGEVNMGSPDTLSDFVDWGISNFPAHKFILVLWDHGGGWQGVCWDETSEYDNLNLTDLSSAMSSVVTSNPGFEFDIIGFDACEMAGIEAYSELCPYTSYFVGSQTDEPFQGWNYELSLYHLSQSPAMSASQLAMNLVDDYVLSYGTPVPGYYQTDVTMSAFRSDGIPAVVSAANTLAEEMIDQMDDQHNYYRYCRDNCASLYNVYVDLFDYAYWLSQYVPTAQVRFDAQDLMTAISNAFVYADSYDDPGDLDLEDLGGLSAYFPASYVDRTAYNALGASFIESTLWNEMLNDYFSEISAVNDPVEIVSFSPASDVAIVAGSSCDLSVTVSDDDADIITYFWYVDEVYQPSVTGASASVGTDDSSIGEHIIEVQVWDGMSWDAQIWTLTVLAKPDLTITDYYLMDTNGQMLADATSGRPVYCLIEVSNEGGSDATAFNVTCYIDSVLFCQWNIDGLSAGNSVVLQTFNFTLSELGMHSIAIVLDSSAQISESNETNNMGAWAIEVVPAKWTVLIYMDGDNNLEPYMIDNFLEMVSVGSDANVSIVVQFDRIPGYDTRFGDWTGCLRFYVGEGMMPTVANATQDPGEVNMGDGATLESFLVWGTNTFQADRYIVVLKDHGSSWYGCCQDQTSSYDILSLDEISYGLSAMVDIIGAPIDLLVFDDCLMGSAEVAVQMDGLALYAVVSETVGWTNNFDYSLLLSALQGNVNASTKELAMGIAQLEHLVDNTTYITQCVAVYDLQRVGAFINALNDFTDDLRTCWSNDTGDVELARMYCSSLKLFLGNEIVDLIQFVHYSMDICQDDDLNSTGQVLLDILDPNSSSPMVLVCRNTPAAAFCNGISIYFPLSNDDLLSEYYSCGDIITESLWDDMLYDYLNYGPCLTLLVADGTMGNDDWYVSSVEMEFLVYDPSSQGVAYLNYSVNGGAWQSYIGGFEIDADGLYSISFFSIGNNAVVEQVRSFDMKVDVTAPSVSTAIDGYVLTLNASDVMSGVDQVYYRIDAGAWQVYSSSFTVGAEGLQYSVQYYAMDEAGNVGDVLTVYVGEDDTVAPEISIAISGHLNNGWYNSTVLVTLSATDIGDSGLEGIYYSFDGVVWHQYVDTLEIGVTGTYHLYYYAVDNFGNREDGESIVKVDVTAPLSNLTVTGHEDGGWFNATVYLDLSATDADSGVGGTWYRVNGGNWTAYTIPFALSSEGATLVQYYSMDRAENQEQQKEIEIDIDTIDPSVNVTVTGLNAEGWGNGSVSCAMTASDSGSGVGSIMYRVNGVEWQEHSVPFGFNATGTYLVECYAVDNAGNSGAIVNVTCKIDVTAPVSGLSFTGAFDGIAYLNSVNVSMAATDIGSDVKMLMLSLDNETWTEVVNVVTINGSGAINIWYFSVDNVGNAEAVRSITITVVEATAPAQVSGLLTNVSDGKVVLTWNEPDDGGSAIISYMVYRSLNDGPAELVATLTVREYVDETMEPGDKCTYEVVAVNLIGIGVPSEPLTVYMPSETGPDMSLVAIIAIVIAIAALGALLVLRKKK